MSRLLRTTQIGSIEPTNTIALPIDAGNPVAKG